MRHVFLTGAFGFIGSHVLKLLVESGHSVTALVRKDPTIHLHNVNWITDDLRTVDWARHFPSGCDMVVHCAALVTDWAPDREFVETNVAGTKRLVKAAVKNRVSNFTYISAIDVKARVNGTLGEDGYSRLQCSYVRSKVAAEKIVIGSACYFHSVNIIRPAWVVGKRDKVFFPEIVDLLANNRFAFVGSPDITTYLCRVETVAHEVVRLVSRPRPGFNIMECCEYSITWRQLISLFAHRLGSRIPKVCLPRYAAVPMAEVFEFIWRKLPMRGKPLLTLTAVELLAAEYELSNASASPDTMDPNFVLRLDELIRWHIYKHFSERPAMGLVTVSQKYSTC